MSSKNGDILEIFVTFTDVFFIKCTLTFFGFLNVYYIYSMTDVVVSQFYDVLAVWKKEKSRDSVANSK